MKIIGMIPARLGSKRIKNKNLRLIDGIPLIQYIINAAKKSNLLDEIYLNSESIKFKEIADKSGINFYQRPSHLSSDDATNDDFALDFINNVECDILIQLLATSPFVESKHIDEFIQLMLDGDFETMLSVSHVQIECIFKGKPINFDKLKKTPPSQDLEPINAYACSLMGWETNRYLDNIKKFKSAYHGGDGSIGSYVLKGYATIDIDYEEDFLLAEAVASALKSKPKTPKYYLGSEDIIADSDRERILNEDGVISNNLCDYNKEVAHVDEIIAKNGRSSSWSHTLVNSMSTCSTLIAQMPGEGNRMHYHPDWDEWWYIIEGEWEWLIEDKPKKIVKGDVVFIHRNRKHKITAVGESMAIRLAVSRADVDHVYDVDNY